MAVAILSGFALALVAPFLHRSARGATGWILALLPLGLTLYFSSYLGAVADGATFSTVHSWVPFLDVRLSFYLDGLGLLFALLICGIGALILIYAGGYLSGHPHLGRLYAFLLMFMASMLGLVLADNLILLFVFWELTSLSSYFLIGFDHERKEARSAALQALLVTGAGGLALLAGLLLLGQAGGHFELSALLARIQEEPGRVREHPLYLGLLLLLLLGAFTKSAQVPFHFWLPSAMEAPTPVSAYLHSATMVKAGVYLLARLHPILGTTVEWYWLVTGFGTVTMLVGGYLALCATDLKRVLAYSTVSALGMLTLLLGMGVSGAVQGAVVFLLAHALYKGALFMVAGAIDHETGTRNLDRLGGLWRAMPGTALAAGLAALSLAGFGPFLSFIGKEMILEAVWAVRPARFILAPATILASGFFVAVAALVGFRPFFGEPRPTPRPAHEAPWSLRLGPTLLALAGLAAGLFPAPVGKVLVQPTVGAVLGQSEDVVLALWHGFNVALGLSAVSLLLGLVFYLGWTRLHRLHARLEGVQRLGPEGWYELSLRGLNGLASLQTRVLQNGYLRYYLWTVFATITGLVGYTLLTRSELVVLPALGEVRFYEGVLVGLILLAIVLTVLARSRLASIAALGGVGYGVALMFVLFGAPDLAMTQFLVETLTVILFVLVFYHLPPTAKFSHWPGRLGDALLALAVGVLMGILVLVAHEIQYYETISSYFAEESLPRGYGRNVVNVILVDFRGLDTLGEITVLAVAGVGVYALLKLRPAKPATERAEVRSSESSAPREDGSGPGTGAARESVRP